MDEIRVYYVPLASVAPTSDVSQPEWEALEYRVEELEDGQDLGDLNDVDTSGVAAGYVLVRNGADDGYELQPPVGGVATVEDDGTPVNTADVVLLDFGDGITATETAPGEVAVAVAFSGSGSSTSAARSDHVHGAPVGKRNVFAATGVLSSGTRSLVSTTFGPLTNGITYDIDAFFVVRARNNVNSGTFNLLCRVGADGAYPQLSRNVQTVGGVPVDQLIDFGDANGDMVAVGAGSSLAISFSAQFSSGDAVDLRDGWYRVVARPRR